MKKLTFLPALILACAHPVLAQTVSPYRVDNFDLASGVRIEVLQTPSISKQPRRMARPASLSNTQPGTANATKDALTSQTISPIKTPTRPTEATVSNLLSGFTTGDAKVDSFIVDSGTRNSVDPLLLYAIMHQESTFNPRALSPKGARGLMQLMPQTAVRFGVTSIFDPRQNIEGAARYVRFLLDQFDGNVELALAGYNAGEGAVIKYGNRIPPYSETREYVRRISRRYGLMSDPLTYRYANKLSRDQLAAVRAKESAPLTIYERSVFAVRLSDGRLQLISQ
jgi:soluble lytic murein transglycosylase-like protein